MLATTVNSKRRQSYLSFNKQQTKLGDVLPSKQKHMSTENVKDWNFKIQFPSNSNFINRIKSVEFGPAKSSGNPMLTVKCEVISPEVVDVAGELVNIAGVETTNYYTTKVIGDDERSTQVLERLTGTNPEQPGLITILFPDNPEFVKDFNSENPSQDTLKAMVGKCIMTAMSPKVEPMTATPTSEQIEDAKAKRQRPVGSPMKHPVTGKPLTSYRPQINEVFALAPEGAGANRHY